MGGCSSQMGEEIVTIKKFDFNTDHTKNFEKGEIYYMFNREDK